MDESTWAYWGKSTHGTRVQMEKSTHRDEYMKKNIYRGEYTQKRVQTMEFNFLR